MSEGGVRLLVRDVHAISSRPWIFVTGTLEGGDLRIGDEVSIEYRESVASAVIRSIEMHSPPGTTTVAVDAALRPRIGPGALISR